MICIAIDNDSDNTVGESYYSAHQAVSKFAEHHIDMVSCIHRKCQTRSGVLLLLLKKIGNARPGEGD